MRRHGGGDGDPGRSRCSVSGVTVDITDRKQAEERQVLLAREVDHRAKNALAVAQAIVRLTRADNIKAYVSAVEGRVNALARVHTLLSLSRWQGAELSKLIDEELAPYSLGGQIKLAGSEVQLLPATAQTLALALHELFTNSAKYGALSTRSGRLAIGWQAENDLLTLTWEESGGPLVRTPKSRGFGTRSLLGQRRIPARWTGTIRLARGRAGVPPRSAVGSQDLRRRQHRASSTPTPLLNYNARWANATPARFGRRHRPRLIGHAPFKPGFRLREIAQRRRVAAGRASFRAARQPARLAQHVRRRVAVGQRAIEKDDLTHIECSRVECTRVDGVILAKSA